MPLCLSFYESVHLPKEILKVLWLNDLAFTIGFSTDIARLWDTCYFCKNGMLFFGTLYESESKVSFLFCVTTYSRETSVCKET